MRILCKLFGHALPVRGWHGDGLYGKVIPGSVDGIGRTHYQILHTCPRCGAYWLAARFSIPLAEPGKGAAV